MHTKVVSFFIQTKKKIKDLRPKMTKIASKGGSFAPKIQVRQYAVQYVLAEIKRFKHAHATLFLLFSFLSLFSLFSFILTTAGSSQDKGDEGKER